MPENTDKVSARQPGGRCKICHNKARTLAQAHAKLAEAKTAAMEKYGLTEPLPDMRDITTLRSFIAATVEAVAAKRMTPAAGNTLLAAAKLGKDLLGLELDLELMRRLEDEGQGGKTL